MPWWGSFSLILFGTWWALSVWKVTSFFSSGASSFILILIISSLQVWPYTPTGITVRCKSNCLHIVSFSSFYFFVFLLYIFWEILTLSLKSITHSSIFSTIPSIFLYWWLHFLYNQNLPPPVPEDWPFPIVPSSCHAFLLEMCGSEFSWSRSLVLSYTWVGQLKGQPYRYVDESSWQVAVGLPYLPALGGFILGGVCRLCLSRHCPQPCLSSAPSFSAVPWCAPGQPCGSGRTCHFSLRQTRTLYLREGSAFLSALSPSVWPFVRDPSRLLSADAAFPGGCRRRGGSPGSSAQRQEPEAGKFFHLELFKILL